MAGVGQRSDAARKTSRVARITRSRLSRQPRIGRASGASSAAMVPCSTARLAEATRDFESAGPASSLPCGRREQPAAWLPGPGQDGDPDGDRDHPPRPLEPPERPRSEPDVAGDVEHLPERTPRPLKDDRHDQQAAPEAEASTTRARRGSEPPPATRASGSSAIAARPAGASELGAGVVPSSPRHLGPDDRQARSNPSPSRVPALTPNSLVPIHSTADFTRPLPRQPESGTVCPRARGEERVEGTEDRR